jgi:putative ABC transport system ATP-binding protein
MDALTSETVLEVRDVVKRYEISDDVVVHALRGVSLAVHKGEMIAIIGPSGSGKSTLMHSIGLLDHPTSGEVLVGGMDVTDMSENELARVRNREIGFVFQAFNLLARTTAEDNVALPLIYSGLGTAQRTARARAALARVGLGERLDHAPNQLSGGQQQRVAIARALVTEPSIVLADEPTGNLDSKSGIEVMAFLQELNRQGITIVIVTHDSKVALHATRVVKIADGRIVEDQDVAPDARIDAQQELDEYLAEHGDGA